MASDYHTSDGENIERLNDTQMRKLKMRQEGSSCDETSSYDDEYYDEEME